MGKLTNLNPSKALAETDIPAAMATDAEVAAAVAAAFNAHTAAPDPHTQYRSKIGQEFDPGTKAVGKSNNNIFGETNACGFEIQGISSSAAYLSFHRPGKWGVHFGLDTTNELKIGGWSLGNVGYRIWHESYGTPVWQSPSDSKLKENIRPIPSGLGFILESKPVSFRYRKDIRDRKDYLGDKFQREKIHYGFLADQFPLQDLVFEKSDSLGIDYVEIIPFLCRAVQEVHEELRDLMEKQKLESNKL